MENTFVIEFEITAKLMSTLTIASLDYLIGQLYLLRLSDWVQLQLLKQFPQTEHVRIYFSHKDFLYFVLINLS